MLVSHGYPPSETAGTERHVAALADALRGRGHEVMVVSATRRPGGSQYARIDEGNVIRIINNIATRPLEEAESDPIIDRLMRQIEDQFCPDLVHVHHLQFLSSSMAFDAPVVATLHDEWAWCASGGLGLTTDGRTCIGPSPERCAPCHAAWRPQPSRAARSLTRAARVLSPLIAPSSLHDLYKRIPPRFRPSAVSRGTPCEPPEAAAARNRSVLGWFKNTDALIVPSAHLQQKATLNGLPGAQLIRHGVTDDWFISPDNKAPRRGFVTLGTVSWHKGTDQVVSAFRSLDLGASEPLRIHGPVLDREAALGHPIGEVLQPSEVRALLQSSRALVLGSRWEENAPLVVLEARAAGCPVIAPGVGGIPELVESGRDGVLADPADPAGLAQAWREFLKSPAMQPAAPPDFDGAVDAILEAYRGVLGKRA